MAIFLRRKSLHHPKKWAGQRQGRPTRAKKWAGRGPPSLIGSATNCNVNCNSTRLLLLLQPFNGLFSRTTWVSRYQKGKTNLDFTGARDSEWQWHQLQTDNHASTPPLCFLQAGCPSCRPTNSVKALKATLQDYRG